MPNNKRERGAAAIELALVGFVLMLLLISGLDLSRLFITSLSLQRAARAGINAGLASETQNPDLQAVERTVLDAARPEKLTGVDVSSRQRCATADGAEVACDKSSANQRAYLELKARVPYHTIGTYPGLPNPMVLSTDIRMRSR